MSEKGDKARKALHDMRWGPHIPDVIERQEHMDAAIKVALQAISSLEAKLEPYERRENGEEFCEAHEDWLPIEEMQMDFEGVWLCQEAWDELVTAAQKEW